MRDIVKDVRILTSTTYYSAGNVYKRSRARGYLTNSISATKQYTRTTKPENPILASTHLSLTMANMKNTTSNGAKKPAHPNKGLFDFSDTDSGLSAGSSSNAGGCSVM